MLPFAEAKFDPPCFALARRQTDASDCHEGSMPLVSFVAPCSEMFYLGSKLAGKRVCVYFAGYFRDW